MARKRRFHDRVVKIVHRRCVVSFQKQEEKEEFEKPPAIDSQSFPCFSRISFAR